MHNFLEKILPHILVFMVLIIVPSQFAIYIFATLYVFGVFVNIKKEKEHAAEKNKYKGATWWEVLGTEPNTPINECARVRKLLSKIYHPDGGSAPNEAAMMRINEAFETRATMPEISSHKHVN